MLSVYQNSDVIVLPSYREGLPKALIEACAIGRPIVTTDVPLNSAYIKKYRLGIAKHQWDENDLWEIVMNNETYASNCMNYRYTLSTKKRVEQFIEIAHNRS